MADGKNETALVLPQGSKVLVQIDEILQTIPEVGEDAWESILTQVLGAVDVKDLDKPWRTDHFRDLDGVTIIVRGIRKAPSEYKGGLPFYFVVDYVNGETGEESVGTTGSVSIVAQLMKMHEMGAFPQEVIPRVAERPTKDGNYPMHLQILT